MQNNIKCPGCGAENPLYHSNCKKCGTFIKDRIVNIDLWTTISQIIENPVAAFRRVIESEHKNYILFILLIVIFKFWVNSNFIYMALFNSDPDLNFMPELVFTGGITLSILFLFSLLIKQFTKKALGTRIKDVFSLITYSLIPHFFAAAILFIIEIIIFGGTVFSVNPSPFFLKAAPAYMLLAFEGLVILWGVLLSVFAFYALSKNRLFSVIAGITINLLLFAGQYISSFFIAFI